MNLALTPSLTTLCTASSVFLPIATTTLVARPFGQILSEAQASSAEEAIAVPEPENQEAASQIEASPPQIASIMVQSAKGRFDPNPVGRAPLPETPASADDEMVTNVAEPDGGDVTVEAAIALPVPVVVGMPAKGRTDTATSAQDQERPAALSHQSVIPSFEISGASLSNTNAVVGTSAVQNEAAVAAPTRNLDLFDDKWIEQVAHDIVDAQSAERELSFRLHPRLLGSLDIRLSSDTTGLAIELCASSEDAARLVASAEPRLIDELRQRGVQVAESSVQSGGNGDGRGSRSAPHPNPLPPFHEPDQLQHADKGQKEKRPNGRFA